MTAAKDLHTLLATAGETGPYVLVGHSTGGTYAMTYAARYPEQVAGMVLLDSSSPHQLTEVSAYAGQYAVMRRGLALLPTLARLGLARLAPAPGLPSPAAEQVDALTSTARAARNGRDELSVVHDVFAQAQALTTLEDRPLAVLSATESLEGAGWAAAQDQIASPLEQPHPPIRGLDARRDARGQGPRGRVGRVPSTRSSTRSAPATPWTRNDLQPVRHSSAQPNPRSSDVTHRPHRTT